MRILYVTVGDASNPGSRYRVYAHLPFLRSLGYEVSVLSPLRRRPGRAGCRLWRVLDLLRAAARAGSADLVVLYRVTLPRPFDRLLRRRARVLVFEYDDAIWLPAPAEPQDAATAARYEANFAATLAVADFVVAGNEMLAARAADVLAEVVPTAVDVARFTPATTAGSRPGFVVGWVGTAENQLEWRRLAPAFRAVVEARPEVRLKVVSDRPPADLGLPVEFERWSLAREAAALDDFDVGIMPLDDTPWNRGKCSIKALQCMAMARPAVLSPVGMNRDVVRAGADGYFAGSSEEWVAHLLELAADRRLTAALGCSARDRVAASFSLEAVAPRLEAALRRAVGR